VRQEKYCRGHAAEDKITPGVRKWLWWASFTANRRPLTVSLLSEDLLAQGTFGDDGWGPRRLAGRHDEGQAAILAGAAARRSLDRGQLDRGLTQLVAYERSDWQSRWVFASTRRHGREATTTISAPIRIA
jgi:hypothetical protein